VSCHRSCPRRPTSSRPPNSSQRTRWPRASPAGPTSSFTSSRSRATSTLGWTSSTSSRSAPSTTRSSTCSASWCCRGSPTGGRRGQARPQRARSVAGASAGGCAPRQIRLRAGALADRCSRTEVRRIPRPAAPCGVSGELAASADTKSPWTATPDCRRAICSVKPTPGASGVTGRAPECQSSQRAVSAPCSAASARPLRPRFRIRDGTAPRCPATAASASTARRRGRASARGRALPPRRSARRADR
jgi:hypothetical protein